MIRARYAWSVTTRGDTTLLQAGRCMGIVLSGGREMIALADVPPCLRSTIDGAIFHRRLNQTPQPSSPRPATTQRTAASNLSGPTDRYTWEATAWKDARWLYTRWDRVQIGWSSSRGKIFVFIVYTLTGKRYVKSSLLTYCIDWQVIDRWKDSRCNNVQMDW